MLSVLFTLAMAAPPFTGVIVYVDDHDHVLVTAQIGDTMALLEGDRRIYVDEKGQRFTQERPGAPVVPHHKAPAASTPMTATKLVDRTIAGRVARCLRFRGGAADEAVDVCVFPDARDAIDVDGNSKDLVAAFAKEGIRGLLASVTLKKGETVISDFHARSLTPSKPPPKRDAFFFVAAPLKP